MKKISSLFFLAFCLVLSFLTMRPSIALRNMSALPVGTVIHSILTPDQMRDEAGDAWALMQGQVLVGSDLDRKHQITNIPDSRGLFLRGYNNGCLDDTDTSVRYCNPDNTALGGYQNDSFKKHEHGGGNHTHWNDMEITATRNWDGSGRNTVTSHKNGQGWHSNHSGSVIQMEGENETRPKSLTLNIYIKVRD